MPDAAWAEQVYDAQVDNWPDRCVNPDQWLDWHQQAANGNYPSIVDVAREQFQRKTPWYVREGLWGFLPKVIESKQTITEIREIPRGAGKTVANTLKELYLMEYVLPYYPGLERENRRLNVISRSARHLADENWFLMHQLIPYYAPWHKFPDGKLWGDPEAAIERQIRRRKFNDRRIDAALGTRLQAYGWDQSVRGSHPFGTDIDDMLTDDNWQHVEDQKRVILSAILPSVVTGGFVQIVGTPQAPSDVVKQLSQSDAWDYLQLPAYDTNGELGYQEKNEQDINAGYLDPDVITCDEDWHCLTPEFLPHAELERRQGSNRADMVAYLREYMLERIVETLQVVNPNDFQSCLNANLTYQYAVPPNHPYPVYCGIDPSRLKKSDMGFTVLDAREGDKKRLLAVETIDAEVEKDPLKLINKVNELHTRYRPMFLVEGNAFQGIIKNLMRALTPGIRIEGLAVTTIKHTSAGWEIVGDQCAANALEIPYGPTESEQVLLEEEAIDPEDLKARKKTEKLREQCLSLMKNQGKIIEDGQTKTDIFSSLYLALKASEENISKTEVVSTDIREADRARLTEAEAKKRLSPEFAKTPHPALASKHRFKDAVNLDRR